MNYSLATISSKRQLTIPKAFRARLGIAPGDRVMLTVQGGGIRFTPLHGSIVAALDDETEMRLPCPLFALRSFALSGAPYNFAEAVDRGRGGRKRLRQGWSGDGRPFTTNRRRGCVRGARTGVGEGDAGGAVTGGLTIGGCARAARCAARSCCHCARIATHPSAQRCEQTSARNATIRLTFLRAQCIPLPFKRASTTSLFALSTTPLPIGYPAA
ncbi:MAG: AbrB/MazE/SpoVT family DNA-binding domain-containing protein [Chloroflexota bacterium]|nr:AbrB/MazE/SpoVT family DNA-binding domain-containing protein [Chloroflexota bacterium]